jgi:Vacuolar sorting protein 9 (VPS9) domain/Ankyrin repeats (many copies)
VTGFRTLTQAQLLSDAIYFSAHETQNWLIYYISRPLLGVFETTSIVPAVISCNVSNDKPASDGTSLSSPAPKKKDIKSFSDLLNNFPMIARQMQPGLERVFNEFGKELGKPLPPPPSTSSSTSHNSDDDDNADAHANGSIHQRRANGHPRLPFNSAEFFDDEEDLMRRALESAVTAAIDLFQLVDKQQLSFLGATTELTGPVVERLIEQYVAEQVHDNLLFPRICSFHRAEDQELDRTIRQMENIDVSQIGIAIDGGKAGKEDLIRRVNKGVEAFRKMGVACSPQEMLKVLLDTEKAVTDAAVSEAISPKSVSEKQRSVMTINADVLVSLLLIVVIRSKTRHLQARLSYMQRFIYIDDVESGEAGYALSTFEAVLSYLTKDAGGLRKASMRNRKLWNATKAGNLSDMKAILELDYTDPDEGMVEEPQEQFGDNEVNGMICETGDWIQGLSVSRSRSSSGASTKASASFGSNLSHVFPFQASSASTSVSIPFKKGKKVSLDIRSLSGSSAMSFRSRTTIGSAASAMEGDVSVESLSRTQDSTGNSIPMMAVEARQPESLRYLLSLEEHYPTHVILEDATSEGTTLLSAAIQLAHTEVIDIIVDYVFRNGDGQADIDYIGKADTRGRTAAHYLFNAPQLLSRLNTKLPWRKKDRIGQTPLFALCRSYDHPDYGAMVSEALSVATEAQGDRLPLRLSDHTDNKGNTLLHIVNDPAIIHRILHHCDADPNATNDKKFTPLMLASKYGRIDMVRVFFGDPRVDANLKELRGLTAVELAKDDEVRNRIDDLTLFSDLSTPPASKTTGRVTRLVRSFFVEDGTTRFILKSGAPSDSSDSSGTTFTITTSRRTLTDFENLARWLALEHPASYLPNISSFRSSFQIISKPSRAILHDIQVSLDRFLRILLAHPTFSTHEMLWEFFLVPDMQSEQMAQRSKLKAELLKETIQDEYEPISDVQDVEQNIAHSQRMIQSVASRTRLLVRRGHTLQHSQNDLADALSMSAAALSSLGPPADSLPAPYVTALKRHASLMTTPADSSPLKGFIESITDFSSTILALQTSFMRPTTLVSQLTATQRSIARHKSSLTSQSLPRKFNFPGMEESRHRAIKDTESKISQGEREVEKMSRELRWTTEVVVGELAGWTAWREDVGREAVKRFVRGMVVREKERGKGLERCLRALREARDNQSQ